MDIIASILWLVDDTDLNIISICIFAVQIFDKSYKLVLLSITKRFSRSGSNYSIT